MTDLPVACMHWIPTCDIHIYTCLGRMGGVGALELVHAVLVRLTMCMHKYEKDVMMN